VKSVLKVPMLLFPAMVAAACLAGCSDPLSRMTVDELLDQGDVHLSGSEFEQAIEHYTAVLEREPKNIRALNNRAVAWAALEEDEQAVSDLSMAIRFSDEVEPTRRGRPFGPCLPLHSMGVMA
jgi:tetratricopeptide (TPR) repeat protein